MCHAMDMSHERVFLSQKGAHTSNSSCHDWCPITTKTRYLKNKYTTGCKDIFLFLSHTGGCGQFVSYVCKEMSFRNNTIRYRLCIDHQFFRNWNVSIFVGHDISTAFQFSNLCSHKWRNFLCLTQCKSNTSYPLCRRIATTCIFPTGRWKVSLRYFNLAFGSISSFSVDLSSFISSSVLPLWGLCSLIALFSRPKNDNILLCFGIIIYTFSSVEECKRLGMKHVHFNKWTSL